MVRGLAVSTALHAATNGRTASACPGAAKEILAATAQATGLARVAGGANPWQETIAAGLIWGRSRVCGG